MMGNFTPSHLVFGKLRQVARHVGTPGVLWTRTLVKEGRRGKLTNWKLQFQKIF
jgi:hypothetical protein